MPTMVKNSGFAFNRFDSHPRAVAAVSAAATVLVGVKTFLSRDEKSFPGWLLLFCGALSNTGERLFKGYVSDYIRIGKYEYNVADFLIFLGTGIIITEELKGELWKE